MSMGLGSFFSGKRSIRRPINPLDKATIISVYPEQIVEEKITIFPSKFIIPAAPADGFSILVIGPSSWFKELGDEQPMLEIPNSAVDIAKSVVNDYCMSVLGWSGDRSPGLFWIPGAHKKETISTFIWPTVEGEPHLNEGKTFKVLLEEAKTRQINWYRELIAIGDRDWARTNGNPLTINKDMRRGAEMLGLEKPWMKDIRMSDLQRCPACGHMVNLDFPVCSNCKTIVNKAKAKELGIVFAG